MEIIYLAIPLAPLAAPSWPACSALIGRAGAHWVTILGVAISFVLSLVVLKHMCLTAQHLQRHGLYLGAVRWHALRGRFPGRPAQT